MPQISDMALKTAEKLLEAAGRLSEHPLSKHTKSMLSSTAQGILEWTAQVCMHLLCVHVRCDSSMVVITTCMYMHACMHSGGSRK